MSVQELTVEQRAELLKKAQAARHERAEIKRGVKAGKISFSQALDMPAAKRIKVKALIASVPHYGERKAEYIMQSADISYKRRVQGLGKHQRAKLIEILG